MVSPLCEFWNVALSEIFHQCGCWCVALSGPSGETFYHKLHICMVFRQCECSNVVSNHCHQQKIYCKHHRRTVSPLFACASVGYKFLLPYTGIVTVMTREWLFSGVGPNMGLQPTFSIKFPPTICTSMLFFVSLRWQSWFS